MGQTPNKKIIRTSEGNKAIEFYSIDENQQFRENALRQRNEVIEARPVPVY
jgi:hypothetical protein